MKLKINIYGHIQNITILQNYKIAKLLTIILFGIIFSDTPKDIVNLLMKIFSLGPDEDRRTC